jgi:hypothetical protein
MHECDCIANENPSTGEWKPLEYAWDGMDVWIRLSRELKTLLKCQVACAAGNLVRVVNQNHRVDKWLPVGALLVPTEEVLRRIMES